MLVLFCWGFWLFFQYTFLVPTRWMSFMKPIVSKGVSVMVPAKWSKLLQCLLPAKQLERAWPKSTGATRSTQRYISSFFSLSHCLKAVGTLPIISGRVEEIKANSAKRNLYLFFFRWIPNDWQRQVTWAQRVPWSNSLDSMRARLYLGTAAQKHKSAPNLLQLPTSSLQI